MIVDSENIAVLLFGIVLSTQELLVDRHSCILCCLQVLSCYLVLPLVTLELWILHQNITRDIGGISKSQYCINKVFILLAPNTEWPVVRTYTNFMCSQIMWPWVQGQVTWGSTTNRKAYVLNKQRNATLTLPFKLSDNLPNLDALIKCWTAWQ